jgi:hypothetical protein
VLVLHALLAVIAFADLGSTATRSSSALFAVARGIASPAGSWPASPAASATACWSRPSRPAPSTRWRSARAAATVGIVIGVVTLTGVGFKISFIITAGRRRSRRPVAVLPAFMADTKA